MRRWVLALATLALLTVGVAPTDAAAADPPRLTSETTRAEVGEQVTFDLTGFRASRVQVELCGSLGVTSSTHCDTAGGALAVPSGKDRTARATIRLSAPPGDCPCRVRAVGLDTRERVVLPVVVLGVPQREPRRPVPAPAPATVAVSAGVVEVDGVAERLRGWVGLARDREVEVAVRNTGTTALTDATVSVRIGRDSADTRPVGTSPLPLIDPGEEATVRVAVTMPGRLPAGRYLVVGEVDGAEAGGDFGTHVSTLPVLLLAAGMFVLLTVLLTGARIVRSRLARRRGVRRRVGQPWLAALAATVLVVAGGLVTRSVWVSWADERASTQAQQSLLTGTGAGTGPAQVATPRRTTAAAIGDLTAVLRLPDDQTWAVVEGVDPDQLRRAPGHYPGTAAPGQVGNAVIVGHAGIPDAPFDDLHLLPEGARISLDTADRTSHYRVTGVREVAATATDVLLPVRSEPGVEPSVAQLTLITCAYEQGVVTGRWVVEAELVPEAAA